MRIYARLEQNINNDFIPTWISLKPFIGECYYIDVTDTPVNIEILDDICGDWNVYTGEKYLGEYFYNLTTGEYIDSPIACIKADEFEYIIIFENGIKINAWDDKYKDWSDNFYCYQKYKDGKPIGNLIFEEY
jgi:hypothetical protein